VISLSLESERGREVDSWEDGRLISELREGLFVLDLLCRSVEDGIVWRVVVSVGVPGGGGGGIAATMSERGRDL